MAAQRGIVVAEFLAVGDAEHLQHEVDAADLLGHRVLDLQPGVHLEEGDGAVLADEELAGTRADIAGLDQDGLAGLVELGALGVGEERRGRLLDELLVAALQRAVTGGDHDDVAVAVGEALGLDVSGTVEVALDEALAAAEGRHGFTGGRLEQFGHLGEVAGDLEAASAAAVGSLDGDRQAVLLGEGDDLFCVRHRVGGAGHQRRADLRSDVPGLHLVAEGFDGGRRRADPDKARVDHCLGEAGVLCKEAVARVDRVRSAAGGDAEDLGDVEVGVGRGEPVQREGLIGEFHEERIRVRVCIDSNALQSRVAGGPDDPNGDLSPVGHQHLGNRH